MYYMILGMWSTIVCVPYYMLQGLMFDEYDRLCGQYMIKGLLSMTDCLG